MPTLKIRIKDGKVVVTADGSKVSCDAAYDLEKALGKVTKSTPTGTKTEDAGLVQKS